MSSVVSTFLTKDPTFYYNRKLYYLFVISYKPFLTIYSYTNYLRPILFSHGFFVVILQNGARHRDRFSTSQPDTSCSYLTFPVMVEFQDHDSQIEIRLYNVIFYQHFS